MRMIDLPFQREVVCDHLRSRLSTLILHGAATQLQYSERRMFVNCLEDCYTAVTANAVAGDEFRVNILTW